MTSSAVYNVVQLGSQSALGTAVSAGVIFPTDPGQLPELDRATTSPEEDHGDISRHHAGRSYHGMRGGGATLAGEARFEDLMEMLEMHVEGGVVPSGGPDYSWQYDFDETSDTLTPYTIETGADAAQDQWRIVDCLVTDFELGFDALTVPGASPWKFSATVLGKDREPHALTAALSAPNPLETILGHHSKLMEGSTSTGYASLTELEAHLAMFRMRSALNLSRLGYGGDEDTFAQYARGSGTVEFEAMVRISATSKTDIHDVWNVDSSLATERRWRIPVAGSGNKALTIDAQVNFTTVQIGNREGERVYQVNGYFVKDATLASRGRITIVNGVSALPSASGS
jgi:hypothetical protein